LLKAWTLNPYSDLTQPNRQSFFKTKLIKYYFKWKWWLCAFECLQPHHLKENEPLITCNYQLNLKTSFWKEKSAQVLHLALTSSLHYMPKLLHYVEHY
jgi:hypothetical protein